MPKLKEEKFPRPVQVVHVAPSVSIVPAETKRIPACGFFDWVNNRDGSYTPVMRIKDAWMRLSEVEKLPLGMSAEVIVKLWQGGFIEGSQPAPNNTVINVRSLIEHVEECAANPDYWQDSEKRSRFRDGLFGSFNN